MRKTVLMFILCLVGCKKTDVSYVEIYYVPDGTSTPISIHCDLVHINFFEDLKVIKINEKETLENISSLINILEPTNLDKEIDARIKMIIYHENKSDTLCLGEFFGTTLNGRIMEDNKELFKLIRKKIYD